MFINCFLTYTTTAVSLTLTTCYIQCKYNINENSLLCFEVIPSSFVSDVFLPCSSVSDDVWFSTLSVGLEISSHGWRFLDVS